MIGSSSSKIASSRYIATTVLTYEGINNKSPKDEWLVSASEVGEREGNFVRPLGGRHSRELAISLYAHGV